MIQGFKKSKSNQSRSRKSRRPLVETLETRALLSASLPTVGSGHLLAHFKATPATVETQPHGNVAKWTALNNSHIELTPAGGPSHGVVFDSTPHNGQPTLHFDGTSSLNGTLPTDHDLTDVTIFWLGQYGTSADESDGRYAYTLGDGGGDNDQMSHQIDDGVLEIWDGDTTHTGVVLATHRDRDMVWRAEYYGGTPHENHAIYSHGSKLHVESDHDGYQVAEDPDLTLGAYSSGAFNFVGQISEFIVFDGILSAHDSAAVEDYLAAQSSQPAPSHHPSHKFSVTAELSGAPNTKVPGYVPNGDPLATATATLTFDVISNTLDYDVDLSGHRYDVTQIHMYNRTASQNGVNGDSVFCWGGRWSDGTGAPETRPDWEFLTGHDHTVGGAYVRDVLQNPNDWYLMLHTEGGHFALDSHGQLIPYSAAHETNVIGQDETDARFNSRVARTLDDRRLREINPHFDPRVEGITDQADFGYLYGETEAEVTAFFDRENPTPFPAVDSHGHEIQLLERDGSGGWQPTPAAIAAGYVPHVEYLFYRYDDQGPSWDFGGPEGAIGGFVNLAPNLVVNNAVVTADEGHTATNSGTFSDGGGHVTISASVGHVHHAHGTWSWSFDTSNGPRDSQTVTLTARDSDGAETSASFHLVVNNVDPNVSANNAVIVVNEGATAKNDGTYSDAGADHITLSTLVGIVADDHHGTWSWSLETSDGPSDGAGVEIHADDGDGGTDSTSFTLIVHNLAPDTKVAGPISALAGAPVTFKLGAMDASPADQAAGFDYEIDWNSDGTVDQTVHGPSGMTVQHTFIPAGATTVTVTATDKDGGESDPVLHEINIIQPVDIDVKPGNPRNRVNVNRRAIQVAILTTADFDAASVDGSTVQLAGVNARRFALRDVDNDGDLDLVLRFAVQDLLDALALDLAPGDRETVDAGLTGKTDAGTDIFGTDFINFFRRARRR